MPQNYVFTIFFNFFRMTIKPLKIFANIIFKSRKLYLNKQKKQNIQNLKIIPYNQKKMQIQHGY